MPYSLFALAPRQLSCSWYPVKMHLAVSCIRSLRMGRIHADGTIRVVVTVYNSGLSVQFDFGLKLILFFLVDLFQLAEAYNLNIVTVENTLKCVILPLLHITHTLTNALSFL